MLLVAALALALALYAALLAWTARVRRAAREPIAIVLGSGGHTREMLQIVEALRRGRPRVFIVAKTDAHSMANASASADDVVLRVTRITEVKERAWRSALRVPAALLEAVWHMLRRQPAVLLCNGPSTCLPFVGAARVLTSARLARTRIVYVETVTRVSRLSRSGALALPLADDFVVQWGALAERLRQQSEQRRWRCFARARVHECTLLPAATRVRRLRAPAGALRVLVTVGTTRFDELVRAATEDAGVLAALRECGVRALTVQYGTGPAPDVDAVRRALPACAEVDVFAHRPRLGEAIAAHDVVISHAGTGTVLEVLASRAVAILVANASLMDDHQSEFVDAVVRAYDGRLRSASVGALADAVREAACVARPRLATPARLHELADVVDGAPTSAE